jgi:hypothetical protein
MNRRTYTVLMLLLAFMMLQVHNLLPHHHENASSHAHVAGHIHDHHHHSEGGNDHHKDKEEDLPFAHLNHSFEFGQTTTGEKDLKLVLKPFLVPTLLPEAFIQFVQKPVNKHSIYSPPDNISFHSLVLYTAVPLRAPPVFAA